MNQTVFVRTISGVILQRDVPSGEYIVNPATGQGEWNTHARQLWEEQIAKGEIQILDVDCVQVPNFDGSGYHWQSTGAASSPGDPGDPPQVVPDEYPADGTIAQILAWVGDDTIRAEAALDAEDETGKPRKSLVAALEAILDTDDNPDTAEA